jgi:predicted membrane channel-forming protein YqfA (hemolysin III family)
MTSWEKVAEIVFILGILVSIVIGTMHYESTQALTLLMFMGIFVGLINIFEVHLKRFLTATVSMLVGTLALVIISNFMRTTALMPLMYITSSLSVFLAPVVIVISGVEIYKLIVEKNPKEERKKIYEENVQPKKKITRKKTKK